MNVGRIELRNEKDVVASRQLARKLAGTLGFDGQDQTRISTAVSEIRDGLRRELDLNPMDELHRQNTELMRALDALRERELELNELNRELEDTNRGVVALYAELDEKAAALQRVSAEVIADDRVRFTVKDTGIGIADKDLERIFEEFAQIENPLQRRVKGTGLGLPLSRRLAELLGGSVTVTSEVGMGSAFSVTVPRTLRGADG
jgi:K+-sensing histidine kinase KdpD